MEYSNKMAMVVNSPTNAKKFEPTIDDEKELVKMRLVHYNWISKVSSVARSTGAKKFLYSEALRRAGVDL